MEQYNRAYRDPHSPLTPLTPLTTNTFNFETNQSPYTPKALAGLAERSKQKLGYPYGTPKFQDQQQKQQQKAQKYNLLPTPKYLSKKIRELRIYNCKNSRGGSSTPSPTREYTSINQPEPPLPRLQVESCCGCVASPKITTNNSNKIDTDGDSDDEATKMKKQNQRFKSASPIAPRMLSPRVRSLLHKINLDHLSGLFCRQEIDSDVLSMMSLEDLKSVGIKKPRELHKLTNAIKYAKEMFR